MVNRSQILLALILLTICAGPMLAREFYNFPPAPDLQERDLFLIRRPAASGFDNATGTRNITARNLLKPFSEYTSQRRAVLRASATFHNISVHTLYTTGNGIRTNYVTANSQVTVGSSQLQSNGDIIGGRLFATGVGFDHISSLIQHRKKKDNPHDVTVAQLGLAPVATSGSYPDLFNLPAETCTGRMSYDGFDGSTIFTAAGVPSGSTGVVKDIHLNTLNGDYYRMDSATIWTLKGNLKGGDGAPGAPGSNGTSATVAVGTVTDLPYGSAPYVNNSGSSLAAILNFGLVTGQTGAAGSPDTPAQILAKIATPTDGAKLLVQQGGAEAGSVSKIEVRDAGGGLTAYVSGDGSITSRKSGKTIFNFDVPTQTLTLYRGDGTTPAFRIYSSGRARHYGALTL